MTFQSNNQKMSDEHEEGEEGGGPTAAFSLVRYENPQVVQLEVNFSSLSLALPSSLSLS